jgi:predicted DNA-binding transcriptional regulator AlpA
VSRDVQTPSLATSDPQTPSTTLADQNESDFDSKWRKEIHKKRLAGLLPPPEGEYLTMLEVAEILKCSRSQVYAMRRNGLLPPAIQLFDGERGWRWLRSDLFEWLRGRKLATDPQPRPGPYVPIRLHTK